MPCHSKTVVKFEPPPSRKNVIHSRVLARCKDSYWKYGCLQYHPPPETLRQPSHPQLRIASVLFKPEPIEMRSKYGNSLPISLYVSEIFMSPVPSPAWPYNNVESTATDPPEIFWQYIFPTLLFGWEKRHVRSAKLHVN